MLDFLKKFLSGSNEAEVKKIRKTVEKINALEPQMQKLSDGWREGVAMLAAREGESPEFDDMLRLARACLCHFESAYHHAAFVLAREADDREGMLSAIRAERETVRALIPLRKADSRIGYEASNHYFYSLTDLAEKLVNLDWAEETLKRR